uniref:Uncharacterized protein n=1 Tax=Caenorhabditis japonica TaxID=281687 RepID=A0A8R1IBH9_CAEJA
MSFPRFRLVQGKAIGERSTPTAPTPNLISTPEPPPQHVIKQEDVHMESNYPLDTHQIKNEPQTSSISMDDALSPPPHLLGNQRMV